jgi:hypothetical protein
MQTDQFWNIAFSAFTLLIIGGYALVIGVLSLIKRKDVGLIYKIFTKFNPTDSQRKLNKKNYHDKYYRIQSLLYISMGLFFIAIAIKIFLEYVF